MRCKVVQRILLACSAALLSLLVCASALAAEKQKAVVIFKESSVYESPSTDSKVIFSVNRGAEVTVVSSADSFYLISYGETSGYMSANNLRLKGTVEPVEGQGTINADAVNVRFKPSLNDQIVAVLKKGTQVKLLSMVDDWFEVDSGKYKGYIQADYLDIEKDELLRAAYTTLRMGATGMDVVRLQEALKTLGYYKSEINGRYGALTREAVKVFQQQEQIKPDGVATGEVQRILYAKVLSVMSNSF